MDEKEGLKQHFSAQALLRSCSHCRQAHQKNTSEEDQWGFSGPMSYIGATVLIGYGLLWFYTGGC